MNALKPQHGQEIASISEDLDSSQNRSTLYEEPYSFMSSAIQKTDSAQAPEILTVESTDGKKHLDHEQARQLAVQYDPNSPEEKKLVRKLDWRLVVSFDLLYRPHCEEITRE